MADKFCRYCNGDGTIDCPACGGTGQYNSAGELKECRECDGKGICCCPHCEDGTPRNIG